MVLFLLVDYLHVFFEPRTSLLDVDWLANLVFAVLVSLKNNLCKEFAPFWMVLAPPPFFWMRHFFFNQVRHLILVVLVNVLGSFFFS